MNKENVNHTHTHTHTQYRILFNHIKEILPFLITWMELEGIMSSEIKQRKTTTI